MDMNFVSVLSQRNQLPSQVLNAKFTKFLFQMSTALTIIIVSLIINQ
jgi:hypothetical protein